MSVKRDLAELQQTCAIVYSNLVGRRVSFCQEVIELLPTAAQVAGGATARAEKAEKERDEARAALREAMDWCRPINESGMEWKRWRKAAGLERVSKGVAE